MPSGRTKDVIFGGGGSFRIVTPLLCSHVSVRKSKSIGKDLPVNDLTLNTSD